MAVRKVENGQFKAEKWTVHLIRRDTWLYQLFCLLVFFFLFHNQLQHCRGSAKRVKKEDKATAGYRLSNSPRSPGRHIPPQIIFTPDYRVSNQPLTHTTIHFLRPTQTETRLSCSVRATRGSSGFLLNAENILPMQTRCLPRKQLHSTNHRMRFCLCPHRCQRLHTQSVRACQSECASPGGGEITEERHAAAGCQGKDLYRAVTAAETDIGRHGMHDKSWWTGGTRLKNQEHTVDRAEGGGANKELTFWVIWETDYVLVTHTKTY